MGVVEFGVGQLVGDFLGQLWGEMREQSELGPRGAENKGRLCPAAPQLHLTWRSKLSSWCRMGMFSYSAALEMISIRPRTLVLALRDMLKSSEGQKGKRGWEQASGVKLGNVRDAFRQRTRSLTLNVEGFMHAVLSLLHPQHPE